MRLAGAARPPTVSLSGRLANVRKHTSFPLVGRENRCAYRGASDFGVVPRRKYGRMIKPMPAKVEPRKCRFCKAGRPCPVHGEKRD